MKLPESIKLLELDNEDETLDKLNELSGSELLELQKVADKITEFVLTLQLAREIVWEANDIN